MSLQHRYRLVFKFGASHSGWINQLTGKEFKFPAGVDLTIQVAISKDKLPLSLCGISDLASTKLEIKDYPGTPPAASDPVLAGPFAGVIDDPDLTIEDWQNDASQHATFTINSTESAIASGTRWMVLSGVKNDSTKVSIGWGTFEVEQDGTDG